jgi:hypothetical protein
MSLCIITVRGLHGVPEAFESQETEFTLGSESAEDVFALSGEGVAARHARLGIPIANRSGMSRP